MAKAFMVIKTGSVLMFSTESFADMMLLLRTYMTVNCFRLCLILRTVAILSAVILPLQEGSLMNCWN